LVLCCRIGQQALKLMCRILVVEDNEGLRDLIRTLLSHQGYEVVEAANGVEAMMQLKIHERVDLVLSDIHMPDMDGIRLIEFLRLNYPTIPIVIASAYIYQIQDALKRGAIYHLIKPFSNQQLVDTIRSVMVG